MSQVTDGTKESVGESSLAAELRRTVEIVARLREPGGCAWDQAQTHDSMMPHLLEETYETISAWRKGDEANFREELGDMLLQVVMHGRIAEERGAFGLEDVARTLNEKLVRRHPHVFGEDAGKNLTEAEILKRWEEIKREEKRSLPGAEEEGKKAPSVLDGIPDDWPMLMRAQKIQHRAARVGFDWPDAVSALDKVAEEVTEVREALAEGQTAAEVEAELGDLLFAVVAVIRLRGIEAEELMRRATEKFTRRFQGMETMLRERGLDWSGRTPEELDGLWNAVKRMERA